MPDLIVVEFPKPPAPSARPLPPDVFDVHPRPWRQGESKTGTTEVRDATGRVVVVTRGTGSIVAGNDDRIPASAVAQRIIDAVNGYPVPGRQFDRLTAGRPEPLRRAGRE